MNAIKLVLAEDHILIAKGITTILKTLNTKIEVLETDSCAGLMELMHTSESKFAIVDLNLVDGFALHTIDSILKTYPNSYIMIYTSFPGKLYASKLFQMGISSFVNKQSSEEELTFALQKLLEQEIYISPDFLPLVLSESKQHEPHEFEFKSLSAQEMNVVEHLCNGLQTKQIAHTMGIQANTAATYKKRAFQKLNISNLVQLVKLYETYSFQKSLQKEMEVN